MCGIFGQFGTLSNADIIHRMARCLAHRGPDGYGVHSGDKLAFGAGRLAIIDLSAPAGPIFNETDTIGIAFNGEIYNYADLRRQLVQDGHVFRTQTDTEVIVHGYEAWGVDVLHRLDGMFAFALWDADRERLLLARDRIGEKPLYYTRLHDGTVLFASEAKALFEHPNLTPAVNHAALPYYLTLGYTPPPLTLFDNVYKLAPGEYLLVTQDDLKTVTYWTPQATPQPHPLSFDETAHRLRHAVETAVASRMVSDVPVGAYLSGGVDSTSVAALMQRHTQAPLHTFTAGFDFATDSYGDQKFNVDAHYAAQAAAHLGTVHHAIIMDETLIPAMLPHLIYHLDEPIAQHAIMQTAYIAAIARESGVPVLLSGDAADELFMGYAHYRADRVLQRLALLPRSIRRHLLAPVLERIGRLQPYARKLRQVDDPIERYLAWMRVMQIDEAASVLQQPANNVQQALSDVLLPLLNTPRNTSFTENIAYASLRLWIAEDSNMRVDKMSMMMSIESRAPLETPSLVEMALGIPLAYKLRDNDFKRVFKIAMQDVLPPAILSRPKWGFIPPTSDWLRTILYPYVKTYLAYDYVQAAGLCDPMLVTRLVNDHIERRAYHLHTVWALLVLHMWHALYIDGTLQRGEPLTAADVVAHSRHHIQNGNKS